jgi:hypothetical protein
MRELAGNNRRTRRWIAGVVVAFALPAACAAETPVMSAPPSSSSATQALAQLRIDDRPSPAGTYRREDWPHWHDVDGDGCDAREQALVAQSSGPAQVDPFGCRVVAGDWASPYDGLATSDPGELDVDHVVSLEDAFVSGGWTWTAEQRVAFANDQRNLLVVSASSNRSKGSATVDRWRPLDEGAWCATANRIVDVKTVHRLTVTTAERDALGQMLDTC